MVNWILTQLFFKEDTPLQTNRPYIATKTASDLLVRPYYETCNLLMNITLCSNNYGTDHFPEKLIPLTISKVLNDEKVHVYGDCKKIPDWLHVGDHCAAIDLVLHQQSVSGKMYNVGAHNERANLEVVKTIINTLVKSEELIQILTDRLGDNKRGAIVTSKLLELGWKQTFTLRQGIRRLSSGILTMLNGGNKYLVTKRINNYEQ